MQNYLRKKNSLLVIVRKNIFTDAKQQSHVESHLCDQTPIVAATDYVRAYAEQIRPYINCPYLVLGTDGYGRSDSRQNLREFFSINADSIVYHSVWQLVQSGRADTRLLEQLRDKLDSDRIEKDPTTI